MDDKQYEQQYTKGYNDGYLLSRYEPDTLKRLMEKPPEESVYFKGMTSGKAAHERELFLQNLQQSREMNQQLKQQNKGPRPR